MQGVLGEREEDQPAMAAVKQRTSSQGSGASSSVEMA